MSKRGHELEDKERKGKERKGKGKERKGKERKGKERKGKERKGMKKGMKKANATLIHTSATLITLIPLNGELFTANTVGKFAIAYSSDSDANSLQIGRFSHKCRSAIATISMQFSTVMLCCRYSQHWSLYLYKLFEEERMEDKRRRK